jgi:LuxR family transcriptional regulator, maltose regulon positive regulatory protein
MSGTTARPRTPRPRLPKGLARDPILPSKITVPAPPAWVVPRPRLAQRIAEGTQGLLTSITGPPGAGKTVAAASWAAASRRGLVAWVTLDEFDDRPEAFWSHVVAALRRAGVTVPGAAAVLASREAAGRAFPLQVASALAGYGLPVTLVLDDFQYAADPELLGGLTYVLRNARPGLRLVTASRTDPPLPLHRYRLTGDLTEIRAGALAFTVTEAAALMARHGVTLPAASLAELTERSEGWAAGLRMAAMSMADDPDSGPCTESLIAEDSAITRYLVAEVLGPRPPEVRDLLLRTSILDQVNADIAGALTDGGPGAAALDALAEVNAFVHPVGQGWYRYHPWFRAVLQLKLRCERPQLLADLHRQAAGWYQRHRMLADATRHATRAADRGLAARIIVDGLAIGQRLGPGPGELPADGFHVVPEGDASPQFHLAAAAVALAEARDQAAARALAAADRTLGWLPEDREFVTRFAAATIRFGMACREGDLGAAGAAAATARQLFEKSPETEHAARPEMLAQLLSGRGILALWSGRLNEAAALFTCTAELLEDLESWRDPGPLALSGSERQLAASRGYRALVDALRGRPKAAARFAHEGNAVLGDGPAAHGDPASALALALVYLEAGDLRASRRQLRLADAALAARPHRLLIAVGCLAAARSSLAEGGANGALETIGRARHGWSPPAWLDHLLTVAESRAQTAAGDGAAALAAARQAGPDSALDARVALSRAWLATGNAGEARRVLAPALDAPAGGPGDRVRPEAWLTDALLSLRDDDRARGRRSLERALVLGEALRVRLPFVTERGWLRPVLARHPDLVSAHRQFLGSELVAVDAALARQRPAEQEAPIVVDSLSDRERDVLRHVGEMLDTADIAAAMHISVNTVKTHLKSIAKKLGTSDRRAAVRRARQLDLL